MTLRVWIPSVPLERAKEKTGIQPNMERARFFGDDIFAKSPFAGFASTKMIASRDPAGNRLRFLVSPLATGNGPLAPIHIPLASIHNPIHKMLRQGRGLDG